MRRLLIFMSLLAAVALAAPAAQAAPFVAHLTTPHSQPRANHKWRITVTARTSSGHSLHATAFYQFLYQGQVVSTQYPSPGKPPGTAKKPYAFTGSYSDDMTFPARSVGIPLTLRVVVKVAGKGTVNLNKNVRVRK